MLLQPRPLTSSWANQSPNLNLSPFAFFGSGRSSRLCAPKATSPAWVIFLELCLLHSVSNPRQKNPSHWRGQT
ncbi:mCG1042167 [Mus musculus]|nr:mCG1042167 [Mus musculus]